MELRADHMKSLLLQEKAVKLESKRVEALMKKLAAQQVQQEKEEGEKRQEEALKKARQEFEVEKAEAVKRAREEEKAAAAAEAKRVAGLEEEKRKNIILSAEKEKQVLDLILSDYPLGQCCSKLVYLLWHAFHRLLIHVSTLQVKAILAVMKQL